MIENMPTSLFSHNHLQQVQQVQPVPALRPADDSPARNASALGSMVKGIQERLRLSYNDVLQPLGQLQDMKPADMLMLQARLATHSARVTIVKSIADECSRAVNTLVNR
ncbi:hypothetical protein [Herbaspirillum sp. YR522]|uniref:hypothetical protein n=1 Tax=Herbaspirillum sp. YR522 TaxID=1144342 RepID=UPI00026FC4FF|nr:hypothetical protein [Herbaspirillum sp. YR522]EJN02570.1 hypothetical protein PMI40_03108 [Herbaspirillum sp. YR522]